MEKKNQLQSALRTNTVTKRHCTCVLIIHKEEFSHTYTHRIAKREEQTNLVPEIYWLGVTPA